MGSPLSPVAANLYMENFEKIALERAQKKPKLWVRYVDDVWAVWPHGKESLDDFLQHINSIHPNIKFTIEVENNRKLPFLDVMTTRKLDGSIGHSVYRKPTHTNKYLNAQSHHHPAQKFGVLNTLINRAIHISDKESWNSEKKTLHKTLRDNGYTTGQIQRAFQIQLSKTQNGRQVIPNQEDERPKLAYFPYIQGTTDKIGRILKRHNIKTIFKPTQKLKNCLRSVKDITPLGTPGVYEIPCSCGSVYIGETKRLISTRVKEHIRHTKQQDIEKSAIAEHSFKTKHAIEFDKTKIIAKIPYYYPRKVRETLEIIKQDNNFNKEDSIRLSKSWQSVLRKPY